jgi:hypothetical protein
MNHVPRRFSSQQLRELMAQLRCRLESSRGGEVVRVGPAHSPGDMPSYAINRLIPTRETIRGARVNQLKEWLVEVQFDVGEGDLH